MHFNLRSMCLHCSKRLLLYFVISAVSLWIQTIVKGQGRMLVPPGRSSMWRFGYDTPVNHNDNVLNCGGIVYRYTKAGGKCGTCGDAWDAGSRDNEAGGVYANGIITAVYNPGSKIDVVIDDVIANGGYFEFRLCDNSNYSVPDSQECFQSGLLAIINSTDNKFHHIKNGENKIQLVLPDTVTCERCVLQWKYRTAEHYGCDNINGQDKCCFGCGKIQNEYFACADVAIVNGDSNTYSTASYGYGSANENIEVQKLKRKKRAPTTRRRMQEGIELMSAGPVQSLLLPYMSLLKNRLGQSRRVTGIRTLNGGRLNRPGTGSVTQPIGFNGNNPPMRSMIRVDRPVIRTPISRNRRPGPAFRSAVRVDRPVIRTPVSLNGQPGPIFSWFSPTERPDMRNTFISPISPTADALMIRPVISDPVDKYRNPSSCKAIGPFRTKEMDQWCQQQCSGGNCIINECTCNGKRHPSVQKENCEQCPYGKCIEQSTQWAKSPQLNSLYPGVFNNYSNFLECSNYDKIYGLGNYKVLAEGLPDCGPHPNFRFKRQVTIPLEEEAAYGCCGTRPQVIMPLSVKSKDVSYNVVQLPEDRNQFLVRGVCGRNSTGSCPMCVPEYNFQWVLVYDEKLKTDPPVNFVPVKFAHYCRCINPGYNLGK